MIALNKKIFSEKLKIELENQDISKKELSAYTGITRGAVNALINGRRYPRVSSVVLIAETLQVSIDYLFGITDEKELLKSLDHIPSDFNWELFSKRTLCELKLQGLSQVNFGKMIGMPESSVHKMLKRGFYPSTNRVFNIAHVLNVSVDYLLGFSDKKVKVFYK